MRFSKLFLFLSMGLGISCPPAFSQKAADKEEWIQLFNGRDLSGWDIKITGHDLNDNFGNTFRVEDGLLKVSYDRYDKFNDQFGHIYYNQPFSHYKVRVEYRFVGEQLQGGAEWNVRNSGVMLHSQSARSLGKDQAFPVSLEMQLLGGLGTGPRTTANLCTPGTYVEMDGKVTMQHCINSTSNTYDGDQWVTVEAIVLGDSIIHHLVDGKIVLTYYHPKVGETDTSSIKYFLVTDEMRSRSGQPLKDGYVALQAESHPIQFKTVELLNLKGCMNPKCKHYRSYFVEPGECACKGK
jgi:hypothetical protein